MRPIEAVPVVNGLPAGKRCHEPAELSLVGRDESAWSVDKAPWFFRFGRESLIMRSVVTEW